MAITSHWVALVVEKNNFVIQFYYYDSKNSVDDVLYYTKTNEELDQYWDQEQLERPKKGKKPWPPYRLEIIKQTSRDMKKVLQILIKALKGELQLEQYQINRNFKNLYRTLNEDISAHADINLLHANAVLPSVDVLKNVVKACSSWFNANGRSFLKFFKTQMSKYLYQKHQNKIVVIKQNLSQIYSQLKQYCTIDEIYFNYFDFLAFMLEITN